MKVGLQYALTMASADTSEIQRRYDELFAELQWANGRGFEGVWITEHHFSNYSLTSSPIVLLTKAAEVAPKMRVGTAILVLPIWDPVRLVADISTLDVITRGRVDLGIGRGYQPHELRGFNQDPNKSRERFEEAVDLILQLFSTTDKTFNGKHFNLPVPVTILPRSVQRNHPPIWMAASSPDSIRFAARKGFHFMTPTTWTTAELAVQREFMEVCLRDNGVQSSDREFEANRFVFCGSDEDAVRLAIKESAWQTTLAKSLLQGGTPTKGLNPIPPRSTQTEATMQERLIAGTPDQIVAQFQALADAGVTYVLTQFRYGDLPKELATASLHRFTAEVLPRLAGIKSRPLIASGTVAA